jgi:iron complex transport system ATP-binding protein
MNLHVNDLEFGYTNELVLDGVSFDVKPGECVSILGPNGTGKSTLIKCINGLLDPRNGEIEVNGKNIKNMPRIEMSKIFGYVPQSNASLFPLKVFDMVLLGRRPHLSWRSSKNDFDMVLKALKILNIEDLAMKNYNEISGGQQQKVIIARAVAQETKVLLLDEPISNLDIKHQLEVMELIKMLSEKHQISTIMIIHDLNIAARYSDKIIMMNKGKVVVSGEPEKVLTPDNIIKVYRVLAEVGVVKDKPSIIPLKTQCE